MSYSHEWGAGPHSAVGKVSGYRCESACRSRGGEFDPGPVPYFRGDWSWSNFYGHSPPSAESFKKGCCQLQAKVCARGTGYPLVQACPGKSVVKWTDRPAKTLAVDLGRKATKQNKTWMGHALVPWSPWEGSKCQISFNFNYKVNFKDFYVFSQIKGIKHVKQDFHSVAWVMP